jgi:hypothetical protein
MATIGEQPDLTEQELLTIIENAWRILDGTHPLAGSEWTRVALVFARAAWRELNALRERA